MKRIVKVVIVIAGLVALGYWAFQPAAVPVDIVAVERGNLRVTVNEEGRTRVRDRFVVSAPVPGRMRRIELEPGDPVVANKTVLAQFEPADPTPLDVRTRAELQAQVRAAETSLGGARAERDRLKSELTFAQAELRRAEELLKQRVISQRELEDVQRQFESLTRALESAEFAVRTAQHQLELARASLGQPRGGGGGPIALRSPVDGVVLRILQESEAIVPAGHPLMEIGNVDDLEIVADLLSSAAVRVEPGQPVIIEQWGGSEPLRGRVRRVEPSGFTKISALGVEEQRVNTIIDLEVPSETRATIGDGYRVEARIVVASRENVLKVPTSSLIRHGSDWAVFVVEDGRAVRRPVQVGQRSGLEAEITSGLREGERIIAYPSDAVADGVEVVPRQ